MITRLKKLKYILIITIIFIIGAIVFYSISTINYCNDENNFENESTENGYVIEKLRIKYSGIYEEELNQLLRKQKAGNATKKDYSEMMEKVIFEVPKSQFGWSWRGSYRPNGQAFCSDLIGVVWEELPEQNKKMNKRHELEHLLQCLDEDREYFLDDMEWDANLPSFKEYPIGMLQSLFVTLRYEDRKCRPWTVEFPVVYNNVKDKPFYCLICIIPLISSLVIIYWKRRRSHIHSKVRS